MKSPSILKDEFKYWEITKDIVDQCIDIMLNLRQSGHPGGSRSKVHAMVSTLLSGAMRWDIRDTGKRFADRFVLVAGHCNPVVYATLAVLNESLRIKYVQTGEKQYQNTQGPEFQLVWEDLLTLRQNKGLPGHAEMEGKTLFFKANTGPSGHGSPFAAGAALALKFSGSPEVKVFAFEGEGGFTTGASHETINSAWGLGLGNLVYFLDWNDFGIDDRPFSSIIYGSPEDWFGSHGWHVEGVQNGEDWDEITNAYHRLLVDDEPNIPKIIYSKTRKGRGYHIYDSKSHGAAHKRNSELFWKTKKDFSDKYSIDFDGFGETAAHSWGGQLDQAQAMFKTVFKVMSSNQDYVDYLSSRLVELGESVPKTISTCMVNPNIETNEKDLFDLSSLPEDIFANPGQSIPNRVGFSKYASFLNTTYEKKYGRPLVLAMSADLADSTNISGFAKSYQSSKDDKGLYDKEHNIGSPLFPQGITEFTNAGMMAGAATVNFSENAYEKFHGFFGATSTYGSFSYLKYGPLRLFSQIAQDSDLKVGKFIWVVGHSGPETAEDSRTHFGIFAPGVTQLFPDGHIINLHPWEHNEVAPCLSAALQTDVPIIAIHLTRPPIIIPDRKEMNIASHLDASKGAYIIRDFDQEKEKEGIVIVRGTSSTNSLIQILPHLKENGPNIKIVAAISWELFKRQDKEYRELVIVPNEWNDAMVITNSAIKLMHNWITNSIVKEYSMSPDHDNQWRTGGSVEQIVAESKLDSESLLTGIKIFAQDRVQRLSSVRTT